MHTTNQILDAIAAKHGNCSDYRLAKMLEAASSSTVSNWRKGRSYLSQDYAVLAAELLDWEPAYVIACVEKERAEKDTRVAETDRVIAVWKSVAERFRPIIPGVGSIMALGFALASGLNSPSASAASVQRCISPVDLTAYTLCVLRRLKDRRRQARRWFATIFPAIDVRAALCGA